jgi:hypothetical protein
VKWGGAAVCVLILAAAIVSSRLSIVWKSGRPDRHMGYERGPGGSVEIRFGEGMIWIVRRPAAPPWVLRHESAVRSMVQLNSRQPGYVKPGWTVTRHRYPFRWWPGRFGMYRTIPLTDINNATNETHKAVAVELAVPIWIPFALVATVTALLLWRDRRRPPPGHCQRCGYDLRGNVSGRCPECGAGTG